MDSSYQRDGYLMDMIDEKWRSDELPMEDIRVPIAARPEPEQDNGPSAESLQEQEQKWLDLALSSLNGLPPTSTQS
ncbi:Anaphase-promoting complex subunit 13 [Biomphalaria glabrata]|uniref:Anaphase-promoting complex subunit 13 n=2 Tax=Biomphalaria TaxID=6525 RepID=A0A9W3B2S8_BIOGL|nr:anaphase-promoting complex subunit 13-like [Biomphalaria glabrata]KAI8798946.1 anaphase-promoting complex subunit 13 isoform X1 [Biomphalaria glabrata]KAK0064836.1 anaphase-promoting complex subunit 13 isoform X1 [Biomphalaria pfeifferi]